jgi:hypothetical protein
VPQVDIVNVMIWNQLKPYLPQGTKLTSVRRTARAQLEFIVKTAEKRGYKFTRTPSVADPASWREAVALLRSKGLKVAPPGRSNHSLGIAYDLSGPDLPNIESGVRKAVQENRITLAKSPSAILIEPANKCVHVEIVGAVLFNEQFLDDWRCTA